MLLRRGFRIIALTLAVYFWWVGVGQGLYVGASSGALDSWGGGLKYLTNWVLTLNLIVAFDAIIFEVTRRVKPFNSIVSATLAMNIVVIALYWGMRSIDKTLLDVNTEGWVLFQWIWDSYLHWGMALIVLIEAIIFNSIYDKLGRAFAILMVIFFGYIFWIEAFVSQYNADPCGNINCGFPYPFLNNLEISERIIFYFGVWTLGTTSFFISRLVMRLKKNLQILSSYSSTSMVNK